jgi:hypothetical protein
MVPSPPVDPADLEWLRNLGPSEPASPVVDFEIDRILTIARILATRAAQAVKSALPRLLHDLLWFELADHLGMHHFVEGVVAAATPRWRVDVGVAERRDGLFEARPQRGPNARLFAGMQLSANDFMLTLEEPDPSLTERAAAVEAERITLALTAALFTGALAAVDRLDEEDRDRALPEMAEGHRLIEEYLSSLSPRTRDDFERVSLQLDLLVREQPMDILTRNDARIHRDAMVAFGAYLGRRLAAPLLAMPPRP